jgi:hypothetical protein
MLGVDSGLPRHNITNHFYRRKHAARQATGAALKPCHLQQIGGEMVEPVRFLDNAAQQAMRCFGSKCSP